MTNLNTKQAAKNLRESLINVRIENNTTVIYIFCEALFQGDYQVIWSRYK